jgi:uncharacterized Fe-S cluster-containing radical SAM superfamily protein
MAGLTVTAVDNLTLRVVRQDGRTFRVTRMFGGYAEVVDVTGLAVRCGSIVGAFHYIRTHIPVRVG